MQDQYDFTATPHRGAAHARHTLDLLADALDHYLLVTDDFVDLNRRAIGATADQYHGHVADRSRQCVADFQ